MLSLDFTILNFIYEYCHTRFLDILMPLITDLGNAGFIWIVLTLMLFISKKYRKVGATMLIALMLDVTVCNVILKPLIARIRPCDINTSVHLLISRPTDYSFPSGHTAASFAAVSALYFSKRKFWIPAFFLAILIAFSRLYLYVHYPTDILAGALIGMIIGYIGWKMENLLVHHKNVYFLEKDRKKT